MKTLKTVDVALTDDFLKDLIGKVVHATTNELLDKDGNTHNVWFAGEVAGYQKSVIAYDYTADKFFDTPRVQLHILLTDGMAYTLSDKALEIHELTEDEFLALVAEHTANDLASEIILPEKKEKKIILPGKDF